MGYPLTKKDDLYRIVLENDSSSIAEYLRLIYQQDESACNGIIETLKYVLPYAQNIHPKESLLQAGVTSPEVYLVCIEEELEAWLLADGRAISSYLSRPTHPVKIKDEKNPEKIKNPKKQLNRIFQENIGRRYEDREHAHKIVERLEDFNKIKRSKTFVDFALKATSQKL